MTMGKDNLKEKWTNEYMYGVLLGRILRLTKIIVDENPDDDYYSQALETFEMLKDGLEG